MTDPNQRKNLIDTTFESEEVKEYVNQAYSDIFRVFKSKNIKKNKKSPSKSKKLDDQNNRSKSVANDMKNKSKITENSDIENDILETVPENNNKTRRMTYFQASSPSKNSNLLMKQMTFKQTPNLSTKTIFKKYADTFS